eukprot:scaffold3161_cov118-Isochrysis_galbana.AAC.12
MRAVAILLCVGSGAALLGPSATVVGRQAVRLRHVAPLCQAADEPVAAIAEPAAEPDAPAVQGAAPAPSAAPTRGCEFCGAADVYGGCNGEGRCGSARPICRGACH